jgi:hypothetical protein
MGRDPLLSSRASVRDQPNNNPSKENGELLAVEKPVHIIRRLRSFSITTTQ